MTRETSNVVRYRVSPKAIITERTTVTPIASSGKTGTRRRRRVSTPPTDSRASP
jgi:hypothetical protein